MKTSLFAIFIIAAFSIFLTYSCSEESIHPDSQTIVKEPKIWPRDNPANRQYYDNGNPSGEWGVDYGCRTPAVNCLPDVIVTGEKLNVTNDIFSHSNVWATGELEDFADDYAAELVDIIGSSQTAGVAAGTYVLRTRGTLLDDFRIIYVKQGSTIISVTPIDN